LHTKKGLHKSRVKNMINTISTQFYSNSWEPQSITIFLISTSSHPLSYHSPSLLMVALLAKHEGVCILPWLSESLWKCQSYKKHEMYNVLLLYLSLLPPQSSKIIVFFRAAFKDTYYRISNS
jgi:hypothetical protein